jgi:hypothetical protein
MLGLMSWLCTANPGFVNCQMCIATGTRIGMSIKLIKGMKKIFETKLSINFRGPLILWLCGRSISV